MSNNLHALFREAFPRQLVYFSSKHYAMHLQQYLPPYDPSAPSGFKHDEATPLPLPIHLLYDLDQTKIEQGAPADQLLATPAELIQECIWRWSADPDNFKFAIWTESGNLLQVVQNRLDFIWWAYRIQQIYAAEIQRLQRPGLSASYNVNQDVDLGIDCKIYNLVEEPNPLMITIHMKTDGGYAGAERRRHKREKNGIPQPHSVYVYPPRSGDKAYIPTAWDILRQINSPRYDDPSKSIVVPLSLIAQAKLFKEMDER